MSVTEVGKRPNRIGVVIAEEGEVVRLLEEGGEPERGGECEGAVLFVADGCCDVEREVGSSRCFCREENKVVVAISGRSKDGKSVERDCREEAKEGEASDGQLKAVEVLGKDGSLAREWSREEARVCCSAIDRKGREGS